MGSVAPAPRSRGRKQDGWDSWESRLNINKKGSVRNIDGKVYLDFRYLENRVRETANLPWNKKNAQQERARLDVIMVRVQEGSFRFAEAFPHSKQREFFTGLENENNPLLVTPDQVRFGEYARSWVEVLAGSGRIRGRTLLGYRSYLNLYLIPFFENRTFSQINAVTLDRFVAWVRKRKLQGREISNRSINKILVVLKMVCKSAAIEYGWGGTYTPFFGFRKLPERDAYETIRPFGIEEQAALLNALSPHWRPYFRFAFASGLRPGEQTALKPEDIDWDRGQLHVRRAWTLDERGKQIMGDTKNRYSRRTIPITPVMAEALREQTAIHRRLGGEFLFCTPQGTPVRVDNLRNRVWDRALRKANLARRELKQTRHTFATMALSCGENPLWIAKVMGHRDTNMIIKVYGKYIENGSGGQDGLRLDALLRGTTGNVDEH